MALGYCRPMPPPPHTTSVNSGTGRPAARGYADAVVAGVLDDALAHGARIHAIAGLPGSGKSTLAAQIAVLARARGLRVATLSLDDVYFGRRERQRLARRRHPLFVTRGPPGTHDIDLACATLDALRAGVATRLPRFDKLADRRLPPSRWPTARGVDLVLFDGWCLKVPAEADATLIAPLNPLERDEDPDGLWRRACNEALGSDYPALWARLDRLLWLQAPDFAPVLRWRREQERHARAQQRQAAPATVAIRPGMTPAAIARFVQHFERVGRQALRTLPRIADRRLVLDARRRVIG